LHANDTPFFISCRYSAGAVGINLTQANRVFLLEPAMNPAVEAQAIGRVYRLGQTRNVQIVRLVIKNSVEERLMVLNQKKYGLASSSNATAASANGVMLGSIKTDKAAIMTEEFDYLFQDDDDSSVPMNEKMDVEVAPDRTGSNAMLRKLLSECI
jgi:hypothetical protein